MRMPPYQILDLLNDLVGGLPRCQAIAVDIDIHSVVDIQNIIAVDSVHVLVQRSLGGGQDAGCELFQLHRVGTNGG